jgi:uncharacterized protein (TIGR00730 family)
LRVRFAASRSASCYAEAMNRICVFCGARVGQQPAYVQAARRLGQTLARRRLGLVYGGGHVGLMGAVADASMAAGAEVRGIIPRALMDRELGHEGVSHLEVVDSMHARKARMADLSDAFIALPGGIGTLEELAEVYTWTQLGLHHKPLGLYDVAGYYTHLVAFLDHARDEGFMHEDDRRILIVDDDPDRLLDRLAAWHPSIRKAWLDPSTR